MLQTLLQSGINTLEFSSNIQELDSLKDTEGKVYIINKLSIVRYSNDYNPMLNLYFSRPIPFKRREYRVHVFNSKILGVYEKVPLVSDTNNIPKLFKSYNCKFVRCNLNLEGVRVNLAAQQMCISAVNSLGLVFGGVNLILDKYSNFTICEVNSSPSLNSLNIQRFVEEVNHWYEADVQIGDAYDNQ